MEEPKDSWPALPEKGFISGRCATEEDFQSGRAVFWINSNTHDVRPYAITIPQYVIWRENSEAVGKRAILLQAEETVDAVMTGIHDIEGGYCLCTLDEIELLGVEQPE